MQEIKISIHQLPEQLKSKLCVIHAVCWGWQGVAQICGVQCILRIYLIFCQVRVSKSTALTQIASFLRLLMIEKKTGDNASLNTVQFGDDVHFLFLFPTLSHSLFFCLYPLFSVLSISSIPLFSLAYYFMPWSFYKVPF